MEPKPSPEEVAKFEKKLKSFLRSTGRLFPETPAQVDAFERRHTGNVKLPEFLKNPAEMLERGYMHPVRNTVNTVSEPELTTNMAARKGMNLSDETLRRMAEDRLNARNHNAEKE
ncbi:MAG: hypothetical protein WC780_06170 [Lentimicrobiaceae bacterium]|jgi:hypothetical protein